jgi:transposase
MNEKKPKKQHADRKKYSPQFKDQAVERSIKDGVSQVAKDLGIAESMLYYWRSQKNKGGDTIENQKLQQAEMARLKREVSRLEEENAFLKKVATYFTKDSK